MEIGIFLMPAHPPERPALDLMPPGPARQHLDGVGDASARRAQIRLPSAGEVPDALPILHVGFAWSSIRTDGFIG